LPQVKITFLQNAAKKCISTVHTFVTRQAWNGARGLTLMAKLNYCHTSRDSHDRHQSARHNVAADCTSEWFRDSCKNEQISKEETHGRNIEFPLWHLCYFVISEMSTADNVQCKTLSSLIVIGTANERTGSVTQLTFDRTLSNSPHLFNGMTVRVIGLPIETGPSDCDTERIECFFHSPTLWGKTRNIAFIWWISLSLKSGSLWYSFSMPSRRVHGISLACSSLPHRNSYRRCRLCRKNSLGDRWNMIGKITPCYNQSSPAAPRVRHRNGRRVGYNASCIRTRANGWEPHDRHVRLLPSAVVTYLSRSSHPRRPAAARTGRLDQLRTLRRRICKSY
jgi:hypothetical protein